MKKAALALVRQNLQDQVRVSFCWFGYWTMCQNIRQNHSIHVPCDVIMMWLMRDVDADGVAFRNNRRLKRRTFPIIPMVYMIAGILIDMTS